MMIIYKDKRFGFFEIFNEQNGTMIRSDVYGVDPVMRSFPELIDVGIMGNCGSRKYCKNAGVDCYQKGNTINAPHMTLENFISIAKQATGKTFQFALGGAGDPNKHPQFEDILKTCRALRIIPNMTTSGFLLSDSEVELIKKYCGAAAVSWYSRLNHGRESNPVTIEVVERLLEAGCITNLHYVISNDTIDEAIIRLEQNLIPVGINAIVFILYKPIGNGVTKKVLKHTDVRLKKFFSLVTERKHPFSIGFDTCFTPAILRWANTISTTSIDPCEAATFSMYIDSQMNCYPCSFGIWDKHLSESLGNKTLRDIWMGEKFTSFRSQKKAKCDNCRSRGLCHDGCRLGVDIDLC
jgi:radical SAM additional 4Fe4S-binding domain